MKAFRTIFIISILTIFGCSFTSKNVVLSTSLNQEEFEEVIVEEVIPVIEEEPIEGIEYNNICKFKVTHYCGCSKCCGQYSDGSESEAYGCKGDKLTPMYSIAADPKVIPYGTIVHDIDGNEYRVEDVGGWIKGYHIDLFTGNHQEALNKGVTEIMLYW